MSPDLPVITWPTCCPGGLTRPVGREQAADLAVVFKALGDPARVQLISLLASSEGGQACACDLIEPLGLSQPTVSHHLKVLAEAGLVAREQRGTWAWFSIVPERFAGLADLLSGLTRA